MQIDVGRIRSFDLNPIIFSFNTIVTEILDSGRTKHVIVSNSKTASNSAEIVVVTAGVGRKVNLVDASTAPNVDLPELVFLRKSNCTRNNELIESVSVIEVQLGENEVTLDLARRRI